MTRVCLIALSAALLAAAPRQPAPRESRPIRGESGLVRTYDLILDARFDDVPAELARTCGPAPVEACHVLEATALWWRIQLDPDSRARDDAFSAAVDRAIRSTEAWTVRAPDDPEAWFYLGGAYAARVQWRVLREERLAAARDGRRIKEALERAVALNPTFDDAYFGIGMYQYYADVAPTALKILRFLLLLPGGSREAGLEQMLRARTRGRLLQDEADYQLHVIYLWYERQTNRALEILAQLKRRHPSNPLFQSQTAEIQDVYLHDLTASLASWRELLDEARAGRLALPALAEAQARVAIARHLDTLGLTDEAIVELERVVALKPEAPHGVLALAYLRLGEAHDRLNARASAEPAYRSASALAPAPDPRNIRGEAGARLRRTPNARQAEAFRLSLAGWRAFERAELGAAESILDRAIALNPRDPIARYRLGRVLEAQRRDAAALAQFARVIRDERIAPRPIAGEAYLESARVHERRGQRDRALADYRVASTYFGAAASTHAAAARAIARLSQ
jgi:tetratricopeptide (TPR) repeat protein